MFPTANIPQSFPKCLVRIFPKKRLWKTFNRFHVTGLFLYPLKTSENQKFSDVCRVYRKKSMVLNGLIFWNSLVSKFCVSEIKTEWPVNLWNLSIIRKLKNDLTHPRNDALFPMDFIYCRIVLINFYNCFYYWKNYRLI